MPVTEFISASCECCLTALVLQDCCFLGLPKRLYATITSQSNVGVDSCPCITGTYPLDYNPSILPVFGPWVYDGEITGCGELADETCRLRIGFYCEGGPFTGTAEHPENMHVYVRLDGIGTSVLSSIQWYGDALDNPCSGNGPTIDSTCDPPDFIYLRCDNNSPGRVSCCLTGVGSITAVVTA